MTNRAFDIAYSSETVCLDTLFRLRYGQLINCPFCGNPAAFLRVDGSRGYACPHCGRELNPTAGTIFERTKIDICKWFKAVYLLTKTGRPVTSREVQLQIGVSYKSACHMSGRIKGMAERVNPDARFIEVPGADGPVRVIDPVVFCGLLTD